MTFMQQYATPALGLLAATPAAGFALQNATPTILTWTAPNDGNLHRVIVVGELIVTSGQTGGAVSLEFTDPGGTARTRTVWAGGLSSGYNNVPVGLLQTVEAGTTVSVVQTSAQSGGAATTWSELWGS
jgi:hypothetical protein